MPWAGGAGAEDHPARATRKDALELNWRALRNRWCFEFPRDSLGILSLGGFDAPGVWTTEFGRRSGGAAQRFAGAGCGCFGLGLTCGSDGRGAGGADRSPGLWTSGAAALRIAAAMVWAVGSCS